MHSILAAAIGKEEKAYELFMRTARLDLDDFNNDTEDGCHITSMAGTWGAFVKGFGGLRVREDKLFLAPFLPKSWKSYSFIIGFRGHKVKVNVQQDAITINNDNSSSMTILLHGEKQILEPGKNVFEHVI